MNKENKRSKSFTRRTFLIGALQGAALGVLGARLAWLQIYQGGKYKTLADRNRINTKLLVPNRGEIFDRFGVPLAVNNQNFRLLIIPEQTEDVRDSLEKVSKIVQLEDWRIDDALEKSKKMASFLPIEVRDKLTWTEVSKLEVNISDLPGIVIEEGEIRNYPYSDSTSHLIGYLGAVSKSDLTDDPVLKSPGFKIGKTGIEKSYDEILRGKAGTAHMEVNVRGREVREIDQIGSQGGMPLTLTIDSELQRYVQGRLAEHHSASAIVMDTQTGALYALASHPSFDPNLFTAGISADQWQEILNNPAFPLNNKALTGQYPPGSTFKMITALAALESGVATDKTYVQCTGTYKYGTDRFRCWRLEGHGYVDAVEAIMKSCDTFFYKLSTDIGIDVIASMAQRFGLGQTFDFDIAEERAGLIPTKNWKKKRFKNSWQPGETIVASIGQGYILTTPLQLAVMTARLVNGGYAVQPWLVNYIGRQRIAKRQWPLIGIKNTDLALVKRGMDLVVNAENGTAYGSRIQEEGYSFGGKTGTAQVKRIDRAERARGIMNEDLEWRFRHHALFVGYAPLDNPRYVCSVVVEHGGGGSAVAAPIARDILLETQKRNPAAKDPYMPQV
jgi:penicillin-binding protein 2